jgi:hypothetical protein
VRVQVRAYTLRTHADSKPLAEALKVMERAVTMINEAERAADNAREQGTVSETFICETLLTA